MFVSGPKPPIDPRARVLAFSCLLGSHVVGCDVGRYPTDPSASGGSAGAVSAGGNAGSSVGASSQVTGSNAGNGTGGSTGAGGATAGAAGSAGAISDGGGEEEASREGGGGRGGGGASGAAGSADGASGTDAKEGADADAAKSDAPLPCTAPERASDETCFPGRFYEAESGLFSVGGGIGVSAPPFDAGDASLPPGSFTIGTDPNAAGQRYIAPPAGSSEDQPGSAYVSYDLDLPKTDAYVIWGRFYAPDRAHNCIWARVDGGIWTKWRNTTGEIWHWYTFHIQSDSTVPLSFMLSAGHHNLSIANCTDGVKLDRFYVTSAGERPPGDRTICNPPHTVQIGGTCSPSCGTLGGNSCDPFACIAQTPITAYDCEVCCRIPSIDAGGMTVADASGRD